MAMDRRNYKQLVDTTVEIAQKVGSVEIINRIVDDLKDENEQYRKMVMESKFFPHPSKVVSGPHTKHILY